MRNYGNHGYTVKASELTPLLPENKRQEYNTLLEAGNWGGAGCLLEEYLPTQFPCPELFQMQPEYESEDLKVDEIYATWDREQLFEQKMTLEMQALNSAGVTPEMSNWVTWG